VKVRDTFTSTNHQAHSASLQYQATFGNETGSSTATGNIGYAFPGHGSSFHAGTLGQTITGLGSKAGTVLIRSDLHALPKDGAADVKLLAAAGAADFMIKPVITSPHRGAKIHGGSTTVKGSLRAGANGLPTVVRVNGHKATITATSATHATYKVTFHGSAGKHTIKVVASDAVGNSASASTSVKNG
jgi:hypothetical protein